MSNAISALLGVAGLLLLYSVAKLFGLAVDKLPSLLQSKDAAFKIVLPSFLGMLLAGVLVANLPGALTSEIPDDWSKFIRKAVLGVILARAGLSMDVETLRKKSLTTLCLATVPCSTEASVAALLMRWLRPETSWAFCFCLGFVLASVSPAVVVPSLVALQDDGYGVEKGIPTMVLAAASLDDIISICGFGVSFNIAFSQVDDSESGSVLLLALNAPISIAGGFSTGFLSAYLQFCLTRVALLGMSPGCAREVLLSPSFRAFVLLAVSIAVVFLLDWAGFSAGGYLAVMVQACALASLWNELEAHHKARHKHLEQSSMEDRSLEFVAVAAPDTEAVDNLEVGRELGKPLEVGAAAVSALYKTLWGYAQPALFMLIGAEVLFRNISAASVQTAATILALATSVRILVTYLSVSTSAVLTTKERLFVCLAWLPKATVQAALGSVVLDAARDMDIEDDRVADDAVDVGEVILTLAVLAILVTAPVGAVSIFVTGPRWLQQRAEVQ